MEIKIKYFNQDYPRLVKKEKGDYIDVRIDRIDKLNAKYHGDLTNEVAPEFIKEGSLSIESGDTITFGLGFALDLPDDYSGKLVPRSGTFTRYGLLQTNSPGVIDNIYKGDNDEWLVQMYATRDCTINRFDRICQFRIEKKQPKFNLIESDVLGNDDRGGGYDR